VRESFKNSLDVAAGLVLCQIPAQISFAVLVKLLEARFGDSSVAELHRACLKARRR
jgi:hypothetical protein